MNTTIKVEGFEQILGQQVRFSSSETSFDATVHQVDRLTRHPDAPRQPFSVIFLVTQTNPYEQQTFTLQHPLAGEIPIFLVPVGPADDGMRYEAVFN